MSINSINSAWTEDETGSNKTQLQKLEEGLGAGIIKELLLFSPITVAVLNVYSVISSLKKIPELLQYYFYTFRTVQKDVNMLIEFMVC
jgi:hypothetical protein